MDPDVSTLICELQIHVPQWMNEYKIDGFSVAVTGKTGALWSQGFGYADHMETPASSQMQRHS
jgi:hypothetical protein